jgi:hypothetical protein
MNPDLVFDCCAAVPAEKRAAAMEELLAAIVAIHAERSLPTPSWVDQVRERLRAAPDVVDQ